MHAAVVVLGDIGRSPRMMNHAVSLANAGFQVSLIGYAESEPPLAVRENQNITVRGIPPPWKLPRNPKIAYILLAPIAALTRALTLFCTILQGGNKGVILVQNPPSIPTLLVARVYSWFVDGSALIIDWHNYGYTIMETTGAPRALIKLASVFEHLLGPTADGHLCVSEAMCKDLARNWQIRGARVLYDRAPARFHQRSEEVKRALIQRLEREEGIMRYADFYNEDDTPRADRPPILVSSTSWTPDEDFDMLFAALRNLDMMLLSKSAMGGAPQPSMQLIITGKGPLRAKFEALLKTSPLSKIDVWTVWLKADDYPALLGCAQLGICLHTSSSGLDLPMKVVDMIGSGVPSLAVRYNCIEELVSHGKTGLLFSDSKQLAQQIQQVVGSFPYDTEKLDSMRDRLQSEHGVRWEEEWHRSAAPVILSNIAFYATTSPTPTTSPANISQGRVAAKSPSTDEKKSKKA